MVIAVIKKRVTKSTRVKIVELFIILLFTLLSYNWQEGHQRLKKILSTCIVRTDHRYNYDNIIANRSQLTLILSGRAYKFHQIAAL